MPVVFVGWMRIVVRGQPGPWRPVVEAETEQAAFALLYEFERMKHHSRDLATLPKGRRP